MHSRKISAGILIVAMLWGCAGTLRQEPPDSVIRADVMPSTQGYVAPARSHPQDSPEELTIFAQDPTIDLSRIGQPAEAIRGGSLRTQVDGHLVPLPLEHTDVRAQITLTASSVRVTQRYHNPYTGKIEAVYVFPLPDDAGIHDFIMKIGNRSIRGIIRERDEAQRIYLEARRRGLVASLLTQERANVFTQSVANIEPGKVIDIEIEYFHTVRYHEGTFEFVFPMVVGPRYNPAGFREGVGSVPSGGGAGRTGQRTEVQYLRPEDIAASDIALEVGIDAGSEIAEITCPTHAVRVERPSPSRARITLSPNDRIPNRDFILRYRSADGRIHAAFASFRDRTGGYFSLLVHPPARLSDVPHSPREMVFVVDCSGSMSGRPLEVAKRALLRCLRRLDSEDTFQIFQFSNHTAAMAPSPLPATRENVDRGIRYVEELVAGGGTEMEEVVRIALDAPVAPGRFRIVSFMTDGFIGNDREVVALARSHLGSSRIFSFGVGQSVNRYLLEALARVGRGIAAFISLDDATERVADELYQKIEHPALVDLQIDWGNLGVSDVQPSPLPDLFVGRPIVLTGRFQGLSPGRIRLSGRTAGSPFEMSLEVNADAPAVPQPALPVLWARTKITGLADNLLTSRAPHEEMQEIRRLALAYGLLSDYTAFVAVDSLSQTQGSFGTTVVQPVSVPEGVKYENTVEKK